jgi:hypothetical protein
MALLPYTSRVTTQRGRPRGDDDDRGRRPRREDRDQAPRDESPTEFEEIPATDGAAESTEVEA